MVFVFHRARFLGHDKTHAIVSPTILCLDGASGKLLASWGENRFLEPHGLRVDAHDNVWVTDRALQQVFKFSHDGKLLLTIGTERVAGVDATHFDKPTDIAFASDGSFYVSDGYGNNRVAKFSPTANSCSTGDTKVRVQANLIYRTALQSTRKEMSTSQIAAMRASRFRFERQFLKQWQSPELGRPWSLTVGPDNLLYVVDGGDLSPRASIAASF